MKANVDTDLCAGTGRCEELCPQVFQVKDDVATMQVDTVPEDVEDACRQAMEECPTGAISIEE